MGTYVILAILVLIVVLSIRSSKKHFKGEGGCCGGGGDDEPKVRRQHIKNVVGKKKITIEGMHCDHCKRTVENGLNSLDQINAKVDLKAKTASVTMGREIADDELVATIEGLGYHVTKIEKIA